MAKKLSLIKEPSVELPPCYYRIQAKFAEDILCPSNAIEDSFWQRPLGSMTNVRFSTLDDVNCKVQFRSTTNNRDGWADGRFDDFCQQKFGITFAQLKQMWQSRLGDLDYYWHWIKLERE